MRFWGHDRQVYLMIFPNKEKNRRRCISTSIQRTADPEVTKELHPVFFWKKFLDDFQTLWFLHLSILKRIHKILCGKYFVEFCIRLVAICGFVSFIIISSPSPRDAVFALMNVTEKTSFFTPCSPPPLMTLASLVASHQKLLKKMVILNP